MESQKKVIAEDSAETSNISNDKVAVPNNLSNNSIENLEGKVSLDIEKVYKKFKEQIVSQTKLIESLRDRIEHLEIDSVTKNEDIKKLRNEIHESILVTPSRVLGGSNNQTFAPLKVRSSNNHTSKTITCKKCGKEFTSRKIFRKHSKGHRGYKCVVCRKEFPSRKSRRRHMKKTHNSYSCSMCSKKSYFIDGLKDHFRAKHSGGTFFPQNQPNPQSSTSSQLITIHEIMPYQFPSNKIPPYQLKCKICNQVFNTHASFNRHAKSSHDYKFTCPDCSQIFLQKSLRKKHIKTHYTCQDCKKKVIGEGGLINHCRSKHSHMSIEEIYSLLNIQLPTFQEPVSAQGGDELNELELAFEKDSVEYSDDDLSEEEIEESYDDEDEESDDEIKNERSSDDTEVSDDNDYTEEDDESDEEDYTKEENE